MLSAAVVVIVTAVVLTVATVQSTVGIDTTIGELTSGGFVIRTRTGRRIVRTGLTGRAAIAATGHMPGGRGKVARTAIGGRDRVALGHLAGGRCGAERTGCGTLVARAGAVDAALGHRTAADIRGCGAAGRGAVVALVAVAAGIQETVTGHEAATIAGVGHGGAAEDQTDRQCGGEEQIGLAHEFLQDDGGGRDAYNTRPHRAGAVW